MKKFVIGVLIMSLLMMSLVGCPTDGSGNGTKKDPVVREGVCEEYVTLTLQFKPHTPYYVVPLTFPGVENPEEITGISVRSDDSNDRIDNISIRPKEKDFDTYFDLLLSLSTGDQLSARVSHVNCSSNDDYPSTGTVKFYVKYNWFKGISPF